MSNVIQARVNRVWRDPKGSSFAIARITHNGHTVAMKGDIGFVEVGQNYEFHLDGPIKEGRDDWGPEAKVRRCVPVYDTSGRDILIQFLVRRAGQINRVLAGRVVDHFGTEELIQILNTDPGRISEVDGIGSIRTDSLSSAWKDHQQEVELLQGAAKIGLDIAPIMLLLDKLRVQSKELDSESQSQIVSQLLLEIRSDPYRYYYTGKSTISNMDGLYYYLSGLNGDTRASSSDLRCEAFVVHAIQELRAKTQSTAFSHADLITAADSALAAHGKFPDRPTASFAVDRALSGGDTLRYVAQHNFDGAVFYGLSKDLANDYTSFSFVQRVIKSRLTDRVVLPNGTQMGPGEFVNLSDHHADLLQSYDVLESACTVQPEFNLSDTQKKAVVYMLVHPFALLLGPPGSGKSAILRRLCDFLDMTACSMALMAPTGKAALRMIQATGRPATTIHKALGMTLEDKPASLEPPASVMIVDEASMLGSGMFGCLCHCVLDYNDQIRNGIKLWLVGDPDQLPSVDAGNVLHDLLHEVGFDEIRVPVVRLTEIFRQAEGSGISLAAQSLRPGVMTHYTVSGNDVEEITGDTNQLVDQALTRAVKMGLHLPGEITSWRQMSSEQLQRLLRRMLVLSPMYANELGVDNLNKSFSLALQPLHGRGYADSSIDIKGLTLGVGDRVLATVNDPAGRYVNGSLGTITKISLEGKSKFAHIAFDDRDLMQNVAQVSDSSTEAAYDPEGAVILPGTSGDLVPGYALSVHKAQGAQADLIVFPVDAKMRKMLSWRLVYTAMTRASKHLMLHSSNHPCLHLVSRTDDTQKRETFLALFGTFEFTLE